MSVERDRVRRVLGRIYDRHGTRGLIVLGFAVVVPSIAVQVVVVCGYLARFFGISLAETVRLTAVAQGLAFAGLLVGTAWAWSPFRTLLRWQGDARTTQNAPAAWRATIVLPRTVTRISITIYAFTWASNVLFIHAGHQRAWVAIPVGLAVGVGIATFSMFAIFAIEILTRVMAADIAPRLPADFTSMAPRMSLRTKAAAATPGACLFAGLLVGGFVPTSASHTVRFVVALAVSLGTAIVAVGLSRIAVRAALDPIDDLVDAAARVRDGDLSTPVPLVSADEVGALSRGFNEMLIGLREREALRDRNVELVDELRASRERLVAAADGERRRLERDLHDGAQQRLVLLRLKLGMARHVVEADPAAGVAAIDELRGEIDGALADLRDLAHGIYPAALENEGLPAALREAGERAAIPTSVDCDGAGRYAPEVEAALYFCCLEALQNAAKHAGEGARATVRLAERDGVLRLEVTDDGAGFAPADATASSGLQNMTDRIGALGGVLEINSAPGTGARIGATVPVARTRDE